MIENINHKTKFKEAFCKGDLHHKWANIYGGNVYLSQWAAHRLRVILRLVDSYRLGRSGMALDIGIGSGKLLRELTARGCKAVGVDYSFEFIQELWANPSRKNGGAKFLTIAGDVENLPIRKEAFELITCVGVLEYLPSDQVSLEQMYPILKPGGYLVLVVASYHRIGALFGLLKKKVLRGIIRGKEIKADLTSLNDEVRMVKPLDLRNSAVEAGFEVVKFVCFGGKVWGRYLPIRFYIPGLLYIGDHCLLLLRKPI